MLRKLSTAIFALAAFSLCAAAPAPAHAQNQCCLAAPGAVEVQAELVADGLRRPWALAFLPDGSQLVTERVGNLRHIVNGQISAPIAGLPDIAAEGQGGLLDIALAPDFSENQLIYFTFAKPTGIWRWNTAVARARLDLDALRLENVEELFVASKPSSNGRHFGSRLRFAPDGTLFVTIGDRGDGVRAQDPFDHAGSVVRLNADGSVPSDNPFADGAQGLPQIWSTGHRNPQGAAIHPDTGALWTQSHGPAGGDEVNVPQPGLNYGWPVVGYGNHYSGRPLTFGQSAPGFEQPVYYWDPSIAPSGMAFYAPAEPLVPQWQGSLFIGALKGQHLVRLILDGEQVVGEERYFEGELGRVRDVRQGPDGALWLLTDADPGALYRIVPR